MEALELPAVGLTGAPDVAERILATVWSTLIGRGSTRLGSHWLRVLLAPALLCHKEPAQANSLAGSYDIRAPILEPFRAWKPTILMS